MLRWRGCADGSAGHADPIPLPLRPEVDARNGLIRLFFAFTLMGMITVIVGFVVLHSGGKVEFARAAFTGGFAGVLVIIGLGLRFMRQRATNEPPPTDEGHKAPTPGGAGEEAKDSPGDKAIPERPRRRP